jgi:hypothetical protein
MSAGKVITLIGFTIIFFYALIQIFNFYGIGANVYCAYLFFYVTIALSILILPNSEPTL